MPIGKRFVNDTMIKIFIILFLSFNFTFCYGAFETDDLDLLDDTPHLTFWDTDDNTSWTDRYDTSAASAPYQGRTWYHGTSGGVAEGNPELFIDANNNWNFDSNTLYIDAVNNFIGIGTTTPYTTLTIENPYSADIYLKGGVNDGNYATFLLGEGTGEPPDGSYAEFKRESNATTINPGRLSLTNYGKDIYFSTTIETQEFFIKAGGNIGIGTITPLSKLSINGGLHVGGDSDAGDNNALIDGTLGAGATTFTGLTVNGASTLGNGTDVTTINDVLRLTGLTSDPVSLSNGDIWYRSDLNQIRIRLNTKTFELVLRGV